MPRPEWLVALVLAGCAWPLDPVVGDQSRKGTTLLSACPAFAETLKGIPAGQGPGHSIELSNSTTLWTFEGSDDGVQAVQTDPDVCLGAAMAITSAFDTAPDGLRATPLDLARTGTDVWAFYQAWRPEARAPLGVRAIGGGVAHRDPTTGRFVRRNPLQWTADRPNFGLSAAVDDGWLYAWGCEPEEGNWTRRCSVARVAVSAVEQGAWQYATSVGQFSGQVEDARPVLVGVGEVSVRREGPQRWLVKYIKPLDSKVMLRAGLSPTGPFSAPVELGQCDVPAGAFCTGAVQHGLADGNLGLTWTPSSFGTLSDRRTRWVVVKVPTVL